MSIARLDLLVAGSILIDGIVFGLVFFIPRRGSSQRLPRRAPLNSSRLVQAITAAVAAFGCKLPFLPRLGIDAFGLIRLIYADLVILAPCLGLLVLLVAALTRQGNPGPRVSRGARLAAATALLLAPAGVYATYVEPFRLQLETATVNLPPGRACAGAITIGVLADIQTDRVTDYERDAIDRLMAQQPDVIVFTGDLFHGRPGDWQRELPAFHDLLARLAAPGGVYVVLGDVDWKYQMQSVLKGTQARLLVNDLAQVWLGGRRLTIGGIELGVGTTPEAKRVIDALEAADGEDDVRILLAHRPDVVLHLSPKSRIDLVIAGHTHGGQFVIPLFGPPMTLSKLPRHIAAGGLHELDGNRIYISRGVGWEHGQAPRLRFLCPPDVSLLTLDKGR